MSFWSWNVKWNSWKRRGKLCAWLFPWSSCVRCLVYTDFPCAGRECVCQWGGLGGAPHFAVTFSLAASASPKQACIPRHTLEGETAKLFLSDILIFTSPKESCHIFSGYNTQYLIYALSKKIWQNNKSCIRFMWVNCHFLNFEICMHSKLIVC